MSKFSLLILVSVLTVSSVHAQKADPNTTDSIILAQIINPAEEQATSQGKAPNWDLITAAVKVKYDETATDRAVTKAEIYYYYGKDWGKFSTAIVHFTEAYEDKSDYKLMNKNAKFILRYSTNPEEWKTAQTWVKTAMDKEPANAAYKETYDNLAAKLK